MAYDIAVINATLYEVSLRHHTDIRNPVQLGVNHALGPSLTAQPVSNWPTVVWDCSLTHPRSRFCICLCWNSSCWPIPPSWQRAPKWGLYPHHSSLFLFSKLLTFTDIMGSFSTQLPGVWWSPVECHLEQWLWTADYYLFKSVVPPVFYLRQNSAVLSPPYFGYMATIEDCVKRS